MLQRGGLSGNLLHNRSSGYDRNNDGSFCFNNIVNKVTKKLHKEKQFKLNNSSVYDMKIVEIIQKVYFLKK